VRLCGLSSRGGPLPRLGRPTQRDEGLSRLIKELGIRSRVRRKKFGSYQGEVGEAAPNLLNREFTASSPNEKWVTEVTEFRVAGKKLYLSPVMDLYNGEIVAYESSHRPDFPMVMGMLRKAVKRCGNAATPMLHSDQGWHYRMQPYRAELARYGMKQSMSSRKGNCFDNAAMESFFGTLKAEYCHLTDFCTGSGCLDTLLQLRRPVSSAVPDGLRGVI
jgi:putative transposase